MPADGTRKFWDEDAAYEFVEQRIWPDGPVCPHCGNDKSIGRLRGQSTRVRTYKCYSCRKPFTVKVGTIFEHSKVPMHKWLQAIVLCRGGERLVTAYQVSQVLGVTFKTAKTMLSNIRSRIPGEQTYDEEKSIGLLEPTVRRPE